jgi:hypothetical protein
MVKAEPSLRRPVRSQPDPAIPSKLARDHRWFLLVVALIEGRRVLVPVRVQRVVGGEHQLDSLVVLAKDVADVAGVLQRRPRGWIRSLPDLRAL